MMPWQIQINRIQSNWIDKSIKSHANFDWIESIEVFLACLFILRQPPWSQAKMLDSKTKNVFLLIAFLSIFIEARAITLEQFGRTLNFVHDTCQTKTKVSEGEFQFDFIFKISMSHWFNWPIYQKLWWKSVAVILSRMPLPSVTHIVSWKCCIWWKESTVNFMLPINTPITLFRLNCLWPQSKHSDIVKMPVS